MRAWLLLLALIAPRAEATISTPAVFVPASTDALLLSYLTGLSMSGSALRLRTQLGASASNLDVSPNGAPATGSRISAYSSDFLADSANFAGIELISNFGGVNTLLSNATGTGTLRPLSLAIGDRTGAPFNAMRIFPSNGISFGTTTDPGAGNMLVNRSFIDLVTLSGATRLRRTTTAGQAFVVRNLGDTADSFSILDTGAFTAGAASRVNASGVTALTVADSLGTATGSGTAILAGDVAFATRGGSGFCEMLTAANATDKGLVVFGLNAANYGLFRWSTTNIAAEMISTSGTFNFVEAGTGARALGISIVPNSLTLTGYAAAGANTGVAINAVNGPDTALVVRSAGTTRSSLAATGTWTQTVAGTNAGAGTAAIMQTIASADIATTTVTNTVVSTNLSTFAEGANTLRVARTVRLTAWGTLSTAAAPGTLQLRVLRGAVVLASTGAQTATASLASRGWKGACDVTCRTVGATGTGFAQGLFTFATTATTIAGYDMETTAASTIDTTAAATWALEVTWGTADAANSISVTNAVWEIVN